MLEKADVEAVDQSRLYEDYEGWPNYCKDALSLRVNIPDVKDVDKVVCSGMGGSGIAGDVLLDWLLPQSKIPIYVVKDYHLPSFVDDKTLVIAVSCSGETDETLSTVREGLKAKASIATVSSGGRLESLSIKEGLAHTKIKALKSPRSSFPYLFYPTANILKELCLLRGLEDELKRSVETIESIGESICINRPIEKNPAKLIAQRIHKSIPVIYAPLLLRGSALRFKNSLNENAKLHAIVEVLPELCHNDIEAWIKDGVAYQPLFLRHHGEAQEVSERFRAIMQIIQDAGFKIEEIYTPAHQPLAIIASSIYLLDYTSLYTAVLRGIDPLPTPNIGILKKELQTFHGLLWRE